ncbi:MAG: diacylglycerol kinase family lipid kinase [Treponema sp.]|nr:diacylglycerol kinase family lipid kinase [Treponema sp.]
MLYFIVNESGGSGKARKTWLKVRKVMESRGLEYKALMTTPEITAAELAGNVTSPDGEIDLAVVGGDGTINEVLNGIGSFEKVSLGIIPTGSGNDFARGLGIPKNTAKAVDFMLKSPGRKIDIGRVTFDGGKKRLFAISSGMGMDAVVCRKALSSRLKDFLNKVGLGKFIYIIYTVQTLFSMKTEQFKISFDGKEEIFPDLIFVAAMNCAAEGGGVPMCPDALPDDGRLSVCIAAGIKKIKAFMDLPVLVLGRHKKLKGFTLKSCRTMEIECMNPQTLHCDGEYCGETGKVLVEILPEKLNVKA